MNTPELLRLPNLLSLSRILLAPFIGYFLWKGDTQATVIAVGLLALAGITDFLDGYFARRMKQVSRLGMALDPVADKILAAALVVMLIFFRELPLWLAAVVVGRDLLILAAGMMLLKGSNLVLSSSLTGKYTFTAIVFLLGSYIIRYEYGIRMMTYVTVILVIISTIIYAKSFVLARRGHPPPPFTDRLLYKIFRIVAATLIVAWYLYKLLPSL
jgi:CDP-diacylglycerol--glycerol-3-phosphate 3-phosphatidyltransferase